MGRMSARGMRQVRAMLAASPAVAAITGAVIGTVLAFVLRAPEPALIVTSCAAGAALLSARVRGDATPADRLIANLLVLLNVVVLAWALFGWNGVLVACALIGGPIGLGAGLDFLTRRRRG